MGHHRTSQILPGTLLLTVTGGDDRLVRDVDAKRIFDESTKVPLADGNFVTLGSAIMASQH